MTTVPWEDNLLERKLESDLKDLLKTLVAFSNSVKPGHTATILIGEQDNGTAVGVTNPDNIQKTIRRECDKIYPPILWRSSIYEENGKHCVRVDIENDGSTPHFGGSAWIRKGSETIIASEEIFQRLIDLRTSIVFELSKWLNKEVTIHGNLTNVPEPKQVGLARRLHIFVHRWQREELVKIVFINNYWVTFEKKEPQGRVSEPLNKLILSYDDVRKQLKVIVDY